MKLRRRSPPDIRAWSIDNENGVDGTRAIYVGSRGAIVCFDHHQGGMGVPGYHLELYEQTDAVRSPLATIRGDRAQLADLAVAWLLGGSIRIE